MSRKRTDGFTLVELLMVITIIGILMSMVFPAVSQVLGYMDQATCAARLKDLTTALNKSIAGTKNPYPGLIESRDPSLNSNSKKDTLTVFAGLLAHTGEQTLYDNLRKRTDVAERKLVTGLQCPSDLPPTDNIFFPTSFVGNAGQGRNFRMPSQSSNGSSSNKKNKFRSADGIFVYAIGAAGRTRRLSPNQAKDATKTVVFSENVQAGTWHKIGGYKDRNDMLNNIGFVWEEEKLINPEKETPYDINLPLEFNQHPVSPEESNSNYARPSSLHAGGVNFAFLGGNTAFIEAGINYQVYVHLMTSNWKKSSAVLSPSVRKKWPKLNEETISLDDL